ncbi:DUF647-domain-containing protein [Linderina pennispora]|uniref:DUF647-domain-containing protein n=1 Tax=Linderina pennispora TaxID=61395 RepID=A0A1Y1W168_9FUNG|nr:DUF647-domain-containing protein [Linderina pennispora]ORX66864.1 DUF647-domain-containing protein [Linderina pennispora]
MLCVSRAALVSIRSARGASTPAAWNRSIQIRRYTPKESLAHAPTMKPVSKHAVSQDLVIKQGCLSSTIRRLATRPRCLEFVRSRGEFLGLPVLSTDANVPARKPTAVERLRALVMKGIEAFMPADYKNTVTPEYIPYTKWQFVHNVFGAASGVLSTQAMLYAMGLGAGSLPLSAAYKLGVIYATLVGQRFDSDPKHQRFWSTIWLQCATWLEMLTPLVPHLFLVIGSVANVGKNISWLAIFATKATVNRQFCLKENLGDVTGKVWLASNRRRASWHCHWRANRRYHGWVNIHAAGRFCTAEPDQPVGKPCVAVLRNHAVAELGARAPLAQLALNASAIKAPREVARAEEFIRQVHHITPTADLPGIVVSRRLDRIAHDMPARRSQKSQDLVARMVARAVEQQAGAPNENYYIGYLPESTAHGSTNGNVYLWFSDKASTSDMLLAFYNAMSLRQLLGTRTDVEEAAKRAHGFARRTFEEFTTSLKQRGWDTETIFFSKESRLLRLEETARKE